MNVTLPKPVIPADVRAFVASLGAEDVFQGLLDGLVELFPDLSKIVCEYDPGIYAKDDDVEACDPMVLIKVETTDFDAEDTSSYHRLVRWAVTRYPGRALRYFAFDVVPVGHHDRS